MASFDFVTDDGLRTSLEADATEMAACLEAKAFKAAHVLAGSIIEALLVDQLDSTGYKDLGGTPLLELALGQLISAARAQNVLSQQASDLASVVKTYRNLIHPGRLTRLGERIDGDTATIASALVELVAREVAERKRGTYGYTAQQILTKIERDASSLAILGDLLRSTKDREVERLLIELLPARYLELSAVEPDDESTIPATLRRLRRAHRMAFDATTAEVRQRTAGHYARVLREEAGFEVWTYETALFQARDLALMTPEDAQLARRHLLASLGSTPLGELTESLTGIGADLAEDEVATVVDAYIKAVAARDGPNQRRSTASLLDKLWSECAGPIHSSILKRLEVWEKLRPDLAEWIAQRRSALLLDELPF
jgi:hypothetical protein